jgi:hypothetical protein
MQTEKREKKMNKQWESGRSRIEHGDDAMLTFTIALHGKHAWEMLLDDGDRQHSISHGWATDNPQDWEKAIAPVLRRLFVNGAETNLSAGREYSHREAA